MTVETLESLSLVLDELTNAEFHNSADKVIAVVSFCFSLPKLVERNLLTEKESSLLLRRAYNLANLPQK